MPGPSLDQAEAMALCSGPEALCPAAPQSRFEICSAAVRASGRSSSLGLLVLARPFLQAEQYAGSGAALGCRLEACQEGCG
mmetsp:Transcript_2379/g.2932  ORF Transcript_2379/g.2932 Transcript_2379/m.2932 type:complete len:81 (+) Transcript_2379:236-478(+)